MSLFSYLLLVAALLVSSPAAGQQPPGEQLAQQSDCFSCHATSTEVVGPAWVTIAQRYHDTRPMVRMLASKVIHGSTGSWGTLPMPPHPSLRQADAETIVAWLLTIKGTATRNLAHYSYKSPDGKLVQLSFRVFKDGAQGDVTDDVAQGYDKYDTYCSRCHGLDAAGTGYTPNLQISLQNGLSRHDFLATTMEGRTAKGMPKWAGTLTADEMNQIYYYIKARSLGLIKNGPPPSD
jgi:cytochrome c